MWQQNVGVEYAGLENARKEKKHGTPQVSNMYIFHSSNTQHNAQTALTVTVNKLLTFKQAGRLKAIHTILGLL